MCDHDWTTKQLSTLAYTSNIIHTQIHTLIIYIARTVHSQLHAIKTQRCNVHNINPRNAKIVHRCRTVRPQPKHAKIAHKIEHKQRSPCCSTPIVVVAQCTLRDQATVDNATQHGSYCRTQRLVSPLHTLVFPNIHTTSLNQSIISVISKTEDRYIAWIATKIISRIVSSEQKQQLLN